MNSDLTLMDWFVAIAPLAIVLVAGWFFVRRIGTFYKSYTDLMKRQADALDRIASALEKRG